MEKHLSEFFLKGNLKSDILIFNRFYYPAKYQRTNFIQRFAGAIPDFPEIETLALFWLGWPDSRRQTAQAAADTSQSEREIDRLVYKLYELTEEEIAIVEGKK